MLPKGRTGEGTAAPWVSERLPLDEVNQAVEHVRSGAVARSVIVFD